MDIHLMAWQPNIKKGVHQPVWDQLAYFPEGGNSAGVGNAYDGVRYIYWVIQYGSSTAASTTRLYRYDTWTDGWIYLAAVTSSFNGVDLEYDVGRNLLYILTTGTAMQVFNLNTTAVTVFNQSCAAWTMTTITLALPATLSTGSSLQMIDDANVPTTVDSGAVVASPTPTSTVFSSAAPASAPLGTYGYGFVGLQVRFTSGALAGQRRIITAVTPTSITVGTAFSAAPAVGDAFTIELPTDTAASGTTTTLTVAGSLALPTNNYANSDVIIVSGTGASQRRRIASNTASVLTLAAAVTGNPRTGPFTTAPDATSVFRIVPSSDFLYYLNGNNTTAIYRIDLQQTTGTAWTALTALPAAVNGGGNLMAPQAMDPFGLLVVRGAGTNTLYRYPLGTNTPATITTYFVDTYNTGASTALIHGRRKLWVSMAGSVRAHIIDLVTGLTEGAPMMPYANPGSPDGHRTRFAKTPDGVEFIYQLRAGGQEYWRVPLEWLV